MIVYADTVKNAMLAAVAAAIDAADPEPGRLRLYTAPQPETAGDEITDQTLLAEIVLALPCGEIEGGVLTLAGPLEDGNVPASGEAAWGRLTDGDGNFVADFNVSAESGSAALKLNATTIYQGGILRINQATLTLA